MVTAEDAVHRSLERQLTMAKRTGGSRRRRGSTDRRTAKSRLGSRWALRGSVLAIAVLLVAGYLTLGRDGKQIPSSTGETVDPTFLPTVANQEQPAGPAAQGMVWVPGGEFSMGASDPGLGRLPCVHSREPTSLS